MGLNPGSLFLQHAQQLSEEGNMTNIARSMGVSEWGNESSTWSYSVSIHTSHATCAGGSQEKEPSKGYGQEGYAGRGRMGGESMHA